MDNIARLNIAHFRAMLVAEQDEAKRLILRQSLAKEEAQLAMLSIDLYGAGLKTRTVLD